MPVASAQATDAVDVMAAEWSKVFPERDVSSLGVVSRMLRLIRIFEADREQVLRAVGLEPWSFDTLAILRRRPKLQATPGILMAATLVTSGTITARLKSLESRGWIRRSTAPADRRQVIVSLTVPGREVFDRVFGEVLQCQQRLLAGVTDEQSDQLSAIFHDMLVRLEPAS